MVSAPSANAALSKAQKAFVASGAFSSSFFSRVRCFMSNIVFSFLCNDRFNLRADGWFINIVQAQSHAHSSHRFTDSRSVPQRRLAADISARGGMPLTRARHPNVKFAWR